MIWSPTTSLYGGQPYVGGVLGVVWDASFIEAAAAVVTLFDGVTTSIRLTGVGH